VSFAIRCPGRPMPACLPVMPEAGPPPVNRGRRGPELAPAPQRPDGFRSQARGPRWPDRPPSPRPPPAGPAQAVPRPTDLRGNAPGRLLAARSAYTPVLRPSGAPPAVRPRPGRREALTLPRKHIARAVNLRQGSSHPISVGTVGAPGCTPAGVWSKGDVRRSGSGSAEQTGSRRAGPHPLTAPEGRAQRAPSSSRPWRP